MDHDGKQDHKPGAWLPEQVVDALLTGIARGDFYIICPDGEVSVEMDRKRILWAAADIIESRPPLSRWHPDYAEREKRRVPDRISAVTIAMRRSFDKHAPALSHPAPAEALWVYTLFHRIIMWTRLVRHGIDPASASKLHAVVDGKGLPLRLGITAGQAHDNRLCSTLLSGLAPRTMLLADRGYDAGWIRTLVNEQGAWANIPPKRNRREPICFSPHLYRARNRIERFFNKIKHCRRIATRYDKLAANYLAFVQLASIRLWLRVYEFTT